MAVMDPAVLAERETPAVAVASQPLIRMRGIGKTYRASDVETSALLGVNLDIADGDFVAIMGPSGCGKTTLLNIMGLIDRPSSGSYLLEGAETAHLPEKALAEARKRSIGFVFQSFNLIDELTVFENVEVALLYHGMAARERRERVRGVLSRMKLGHRADHLPQQLSGGQQQRVAIARAVVSRPRLILADEPTGNLDSQNGEDVMELLGQLNAEGATIVMVTHSQAHAQYARRLVHLFDGRIVAETIRSA